MNNKLLIVDDEEVLLRGLKSYLERKGYLVFTALNGETGLDLLRQHQPDLLLLDLHLKEGLQGTETLKQALAFKPNLKVAIFTGFGKDDEVKNNCLQLGAKIVLNKPIILGALKEELDKLKDS